MPETERRVREILEEYAAGVYGNSGRPAQLIGWLLVNAADKHENLSWFLAALDSGLPAKSLLE